MKKHGYSDPVDLGTFKLIRRSSEESTWPSVPLGFAEQLKVLCI